ncbi:hypothetical protein [Pseudomonas sichuanensis]|uniref:hypothetical protein n=1 Tax=Pseudomonas TaxID=286 RepID=UPI0036F10819
MKVEYAQLTKLPQNAISLFCLLGAERISLPYTAFATKYGLKDVNAVVVSELYEVISRGRVIDLTRIYQAIYDGIPDTEDYSDELADQAQCSAICTSYCVSYFLTGDFESVQNSLSKVEDAIDVADVDVEQRIDADVLWSNKLISILQSSDFHNGSFIAQIRQENLKAAVQTVNS